MIGFIFTNPITVVVTVTVAVEVSGKTKVDVVVIVAAVETVTVTVGRLASRPDKRKNRAHVMQINKFRREYICLHPRRIVMPLMVIPKPSPFSPQSHND